MQNDEPQPDSIDFEALRDAGYELLDVSPDGVTLRAPGTIRYFSMTAKIEG